MQSSISRAAAVLVLAVAAIELAARGPLRAVAPGGSADFAAPYAAARAWLLGQNPYDQTLLADILVRQGRELGPDGQPAFTMSVYPPTTFLIIAPVAAFSWPTARLAWIGLLLVLFGASLGALLRLSRIETLDGRLVLLAALIALAPFHTGISRGQPAVLSAALLICAVYALDTRAHVRAGAAMALAVILKPQISAPFILYAAIRRRWQAVSWCLASIAVAVGISIGWLAYHDVDWVSAWVSNVRRENEGGEMDAAGALASQMVDLRPLLVALGVTAPTMAGAAVSIAIGAILVAYRSVVSLNPMLFAAALSVWTVLTGYHRFYDAVLLAIPVAWAMRELSARRTSRRVAAITLMSAAPFLVPGAWMLQRGVMSGVIPVEVAGSWVFRTVILPHQIWALLIMQVALLTALRAASGEPPRDP